MHVVSRSAVAARPTPKVRADEPVEGQPSTGSFGREEATE
jgi:hypothetical protein